jgi:hypothetical protein
MSKKISCLAISLALAFTSIALSSFVFAQSPILIVENPKNGEIINKNEALIKFKVENFTIKDFRRNPPPVVGQGHIHFWIDQTNSTTQNAIQHISKEPYLLTKLEPKEHTLVVELVGNDHISLKPPVKQTVKFTTTGIPGKEGSTQVTPPPTTQTKTGVSQTALGAIIVIVLLAIVAASCGVIFYQRKLGKGKKNQVKKTLGQEEE